MSSIELERSIPVVRPNVRSLWIASVPVVLLLVFLPAYANSYVVIAVTAIYIQILGALGLNLLTGNAGLISLGYSAFLAVGAYANAIYQIDLGLSPLISIPAAVLTAALLGLVIGVPSLRLKGLYLAITTLALAVIINVIITEGGSITRGSAGLNVPALSVLGVKLGSLVAFHYVCLAMVGAFFVITLNIQRSHVGRSLVAIREYEIAAASCGINVVGYKLIAFAISSFYIGVAGALFSHFIGYLNVDSFNPIIGIEALAMIIAGGLGSAFGSILGVVFLTGLAEGLRLVINSTGGSLAELFPTAASTLELRGVVFGVAIILFLRFQPNGVVGLWQAVVASWLRRKE
jgi:branched-chain amino acid transport system permease protein